MELVAKELISSGLGALIGSSIALIATYISHRLQTTEQQKKDREVVKSVLQTIHDEIETLWNAYMQNAGAAVETLEENEPVDRFFPITQDYFTAYTTNMIFLGRISNPDLRKSIVITYTMARALTDSFRLNNELVRRHEHAYWLSESSGSPMHKMQTEAALNSLVQYAVLLKRAHQDLRQQVQLLLGMLRKELGIHVQDFPL